MSWMAWTWPVAVFCIFVVIAITVTGFWEVHYGDGERRGAWGFNTTWGDRLFISILGSGFINLLWIGLVGTTLWIPLFICIAYAFYVYKKV